MAQLVNDGYSIFIIDGNLTQCEADMQLLGISEEIVKEVYAPGRVTVPNEIDEEEDPEIAQAIRMSLQQNESDNDALTSYQQAMAMSQREREEEELRMAIEMSLKNEGQTSNVSQATTSNSTQGEATSEIQNEKPKNEEIDQEEIRQRRLQHFKNLNKND